MSIRLIAAVLLSVVWFVPTSAFGQGSAIGGVLKRAEELEGDIAANQREVSTGPKDRMERVAPGKIDKDAPLKFTKTESGLRYRVLRKSTKEKPKAGSTVVAHYKGWLDDNKIFDSSYRKGQPLKFPLGKVIKGWTEGLQLVGEGGMIELDIPYDLGYGVSGTPGGPIPPRARLHFIVELVSFE